MEKMNFKPLVVMCAIALATLSYAKSHAFGGTATVTYNCPGWSEPCGSASANQTQKACKICPDSVSFGF